MLSEAREIEIGHFSSSPSKGRSRKLLGRLLVTLCSVLILGGLGLIGHGIDTGNSAPHQLGIVALIVGISVVTIATVALYRESIWEFAKGAVLLIGYLVAAGIFIYLVTGLWKGLVLVHEYYDRTHSSDPWTAY